MALTDIAVKSAKPQQKPVKLFDERGLFLLISPAGGKWWRQNYRFDGKQKTLSMGVYPDVSLKDARAKREEARQLVAKGIDPGVQRKAEKATRTLDVANGFEAIAREWYEKFSPSWVKNHANRILRRFERNIFPEIGKLPLVDVTPPVLLAVIRKIENRGAIETAHRALSNCGQVFRYAIATGRAERDPSADLRGALPPAKGEHFAAITEPADVGPMLRMCDGYKGTLTVACALKLAPLVFVRPYELRHAQWKDIDFNKAEWRFEVSKTMTQHIVPLSSQAIAILREVKALTGTSSYVFPSARSWKRPMSDNAILGALRRLGIQKDEMSGHGFRAMARTILDEVLKIRPDIIEHQLAHAVIDPNGRAYNRTAFLPERHQMMQQWADYLESLKSTKSGERESSHQ